MLLELEQTWPKELLAFLDGKYEMLMKHAQHEEKVNKQYLAPENNLPMALMPLNPFLKQKEQAASSVLDLLQSSTLRGWHCTRLTQPEVEHITQNGMQLPNLEMLENRIYQLQADGIISDTIAMRLKTENHANDQSRKDRIWFCFFPPQLAGQSGIERFFRCWGGEALYISHERDPKTRKILMNIGQPCLIEVDVPISALGSKVSLGNKMIRRYLVNRGLKTEEWIDHEDKAIEPIMAENISRFIFHSDAEFIELTGCDQWIPPL